MQMLRILRAVFVSSLLLGSAVACTNSEGTSDDAAATELDGRQFILKFADGYTQVPDSVIRLTFGETTARVSADCNTITGVYRVSDHKLDLSNTEVTEMGCDEDLMAQDAWLGSFFEGDPEMTLKGDTLTLESKDVVLVFVDRKTADPDRPLVGPNWTVDTLITADTASTVPASTEPPTLSFKDDGSFSITTSCNSGSGNYDSTAAALTFTDVTFTESTCTDTDASALSSHIAAVFADGPATYSIEAARLTLEREDIGIAATADE
ncbi:MAG: META domain-containing protein [Polyangiaceae bacterium]